MADSNASISRQVSAPVISRRAYNALAFGLVTVSFLIMWGTYLFTAGGGLYTMFGGMGMLVSLIVALVGTIAGLVIMSKGKKDQNVALSLVGYGLFSLTFGFTIALALMYYDVGTIAYAFGITACLSGIFLVLGVMFPDFFASIGRLLGLSLIAVILIELVAVIFFHADQTIFDYIVILIFCGFIGYDSYQLAMDEPTVPNAIWHASDIYVDIANILLRVLDLLDRR